MKKGSHRVRTRMQCLVPVLLLAVCFGQGCRAQSTWPLWESYAQRAIDAQGRVIDHTAQDRTTSEGQAYAMFFAVVANDRERFDKLLGWTEDNIAGGDLALRLPAWSWGRGPEGNWRTLDQTPASDADLWMAYDLMEAGRLWNEPRYRKTGMAMVVRIAQTEVAFVPGLGAMLLPAPVGFHQDPHTWLLNPSYMPPFLLAYFAKEIPSGPWAGMLQSLRPLYAQGSGAGFAMDWIAAGDGGIHPSMTPAQLAAGIHDKDSIGAYEAIRVYLWLGISDPATPEVRGLLSNVTGMAEYLKSHGAPPEQVNSQGRVISANSPPGFTAAVIPYLHALGLKAPESKQMERLASFWNPALNLFGRNGDYYDQNLALFSTGWTEQKFRFDRNGSLRPEWKLK